MRALFGVVSLLVVLAIVGLTMSRQTRSLSVPLPVTTVPTVGSPNGSASEAVVVGTPREQANAVEQKVKDDIAKAMDQAAAAAKEADDK